MALRITYSKNVMTVQTGTVGDPKPDKFYSETAFFHAVKTVLNRDHKAPDGERFDLIKKLMYKDGHLFGDDHSYYLRDRKWRFCIYDGFWAVRDICKEFNANGTVALTIHHWTEGD